MSIDPRLKISVLLRVQDPPNAARLNTRIREELDAAGVAEESGLDGVFVPEHHMRPDGYVPTPMLLLAALASRTSRIELGTAVLVATLHQPIDIAEQAAYVDVLSEGRVRLGCGLGNYEPEYQLFGIEKKTHVSRFEETLELIRLAWKGEPFVHQGRHFSAKGRIVPPPVSAELWVGASSIPGVQRAGRLGLPWIAPLTPAMSYIEVLAAAYRQAARENGHEARIVLMRDGWVATSLDEVQREWWPHARAEYWTYLRSIPRLDPQRDRHLMSLTAPEQMPFEAHAYDRLVVGDAEQCAQTLVHMAKRIGAEHVVLGLRMSGGPDALEHYRVIRMLGESVAPRARQLLQAG